MGVKRAGYFVVLFAVVLMVIGFGQAAAEKEIIKMSTTTSTENSGLLDVLLPEFTRDTYSTPRYSPKDCSNLSV